MNLKELVNNFWTDSKCGKIEGLAESHEGILATTAKADYNDIFEQINDNIFNPDDFLKAMTWENFFKHVKLMEYLNSDYIEKALDVTSSQPAIGKGEFLFASVFKNLGFAKDKGDLIDLNSGLKIEFKGKRASLSGDGKIWREMNNSIINSIYALFNKNTDHNYFNRKDAEVIADYIKDVKNKEKVVFEVFKRLQNTVLNDEHLARVYATYYLQEYPKLDLFSMIGAMQLHNYLHENNSNMLMMIDKDRGCIGFKAPSTPIESYNIIGHIKLSSWNAGDKGMSVSI